MSEVLLPWLVSSPMYGEVVPILDDGTGPTEYGCDVVYVEAETKLDALHFGVLLFRQMGAHYLRDCENPYAGVRVESMLCQYHGLPEWSAKEKCWICRPCDEAAKAYTVTVCLA